MLQCTLSCWSLHSNAKHHSMLQCTLSCWSLHSNAKHQNHCMSQITNSNHE